MERENKLASWLKSFFPKKGEIFASPEALKYEGEVGSFVSEWSAPSLKLEMRYCDMLRGNTLNPVDKAIYKRLRRRIRNRYYDLKDSDSRRDKVSLDKTAGK